MIFGFLVLLFLEVVAAGVVGSFLEQDARKFSTNCNGKDTAAAQAEGERLNSRISETIVFMSRRRPVGLRVPFLHENLRKEVFYPVH